MDLSTHQRDIPIPISTSYAHSQFYDNTAPPPHLSIPNVCEAKATCLVKYRECLKNHAASIGGNATDGCGEFMPSGEEGTLEALKCSACNCHRNFHRKEIEGDAGGGGSRKLIGYNNYNSNSLIISRPTPHNMIMPIPSESDEMEGIGGGYPRPQMLRKRFRTKFSAEQKEKMLAFAEKAGWRLQKQDESVVQEFCQEIGVKRRVLKVWMHNNKHNLAKKASLASGNLDARMEGMKE